MRIFLLAMLLSLYGCKTPQSGESNDSILKAETDDRLTEKTKNLVDVSDKLNDHINAILAEARAATKPDSGWTPESIKALLEYVYSKTGADKSGTGILVGFAGIGREVSVHSYIGSWFKDNFDPERSEIIFLKFTESVYHNNQIGILTGKVMSHKSKAAADHSIAPVMNFSGVLLGSDKFGHFFQQGYWYYTAGLDTLRARCEYGSTWKATLCFLKKNGASTVQWHKYGCQTLGLAISDLGQLALFLMRIAKPMN